MISGLMTWPDLAPVDRNVLLIVNSPSGDEQAVSNVFDALEARIPAARVHVIATPGWDRWLEARGWSDARVLFSVDAAGRELEINYFLESLEALRWIAARRFAIVLGSAAHNVYNEEVKDLFERRVGIFLGASVFLAHALPEPYVFAFRLDDLLQRFNRGRKATAYRVASRALIDDLQALWVARGKPACEDGRSFDEVTGVLERQLGRDMLAWDEQQAVPLHRADALKTAAEFVSYVESVFHRAVDASEARVAHLNAINADVGRRLSDLQGEIDHRDRLLGELNTQANALQRAIVQQQEETNRRDHRLAELHEELTREVEVRDRRIAELVALHDTLVREVQIRDQNLVDMHAERKQAVALRDAIIAELHEQLGKRS